MNGNRSNRAPFRSLMTVASSLSLIVAALLALASLMAPIPALAVQSLPTPVADQNRIQLWPGNCVAATWSPSGNALAVRPGSGSILVTVAAAVELNAATAQYQTLLPGGSASEWTPVSAVTTVASGTLQLRVDNLTPSPPVNGVLTTIQFRVSPSSSLTTYACSGAYSLFTASTQVYMPIVSRGVISTVVDLTTLTEPDNSVCQANYLLSPNQAYVARLSDANDFYKIQVTQKSSLYFTVTNFTQAGQVQFRTNVGTDCANGILPNGTLFGSSFQSVAGATRSLVVPNVDPGTYYLRVVFSGGGTPPNTDYQMEYSTSTAPPSPYEPNNTPCAAAAIAGATDYAAYPDDDNDWYVLNLQVRSNITLVASHAVTTMQYLIYTGADCAQITSNAQLVTFDGGKTSVTLTIPNAAIGKYFVRVAPTNSYKSSTVLYTFKITTTSALTAQAEDGTLHKNLPSDQTPLPLNIEPEEAPIP